MGGLRTAYRQHGIMLSMDSALGERGKFMRSDQKLVSRVRNSEQNRQEAVTEAVVAVLGRSEAERLSATIYDVEEEARELSCYERHLIRKYERQSSPSSDSAHA